MSVQETTRTDRRRGARRTSGVSGKSHAGGGGASRAWPRPRGRRSFRTFHAEHAATAWSLLLLALTLATGCTAPTPSPEPQPRAQNEADTAGAAVRSTFDSNTHSLRFGDTESTAVLLVPRPAPTSDRTGPLQSQSAPLATPSRFPAILWIGGFGPVDRDESFGIDTDGAPISTLARTTCEAFARRGYVTLRYDKRHVRGRFAVDRARFLDVGLPEFTADAATALAWLRERPEVEADRVIVIGYDEGARIAVHLANTIAPSPHRVVLLSPIVDTMATTFRQQAAHSAVPYLRRYVAAPTGDTVDPAAIGEARLDPAGVVARRIVDALLDPRAVGRPRIARRFDLDGNGRLHLTAELVPAWQRLFDRADPRLDPPTIPPLREQQLPPVPTLIVHGANDGTVPAATVAAALDRGAPHVERVALPDLGHTLGPAASPADDAHRSIEPTALQRVAEWLEKLDADAAPPPPTP